MIDIVILLYFITVDLNFIFISKVILAIQNIKLFVINELTVKKVLDWGYQYHKNFTMVMFGYN